MKTAFWKSMDESKVDEMRAMLADPSLSFAEIGRAYSVKAYQVQSMARAFGAPDRAGRGTRRRVERLETTDLRMVNDQIEELLRKQGELQANLERLKARRDELQLRFEEDGGDVLIHGVAAQPLRATARQWIQFLNMEGARKLREFVVSRGGAQ